MKLLCEGALMVARDVVSSNHRLHDSLSTELHQEERVEGSALQVGPCWDKGGGSVAAGGLVGWLVSFASAFCLVLGESPLD